MGIFPDIHVRFLTNSHQDYADAGIALLLGLNEMVFDIMIPDPEFGISVFWPHFCSEGFLTNVLKMTPDMLISHGLGVRKRL